MYVYALHPFLYVFIFLEKYSYLCMTTRVRLTYKLLFLELYSRTDMEQFFEECFLMKDFNHPNVVELIGMCLDSPDGYPLMILPLFPNGDLKIYLQKSRGFSPMVARLPKVINFFRNFSVQGLRYHSIIY